MTTKTMSKLRYSEFVDSIEASFGYWFSGLVDGEGCFQIFRANKTGYACSFHIAMRADDTPVLELARDTLGIGGLHTYYPKNRNAFSSWQVRSRNECALLKEVLLKFSLRSKKRKDFDLWSQAIELWLDRIPYQRRDSEDYYSKMAILQESMKAGRIYVQA